MTRPATQSNVPGSKAAPHEAGARIPDKPRDCAPNVDTWPILDEQVADAPGPKSGSGNQAHE